MTILPRAITAISDVLPMSMMFLDVPPMGTFAPIAWPSGSSTVASFAPLSARVVDRPLSTDVMPTGR
jgi:hypothetical protein